MCTVMKDIPCGGDAFVLGNGRAIKLDWISVVHGRRALPKISLITV
jgi:hypothetical protein